MYFSNFLFDFLNDSEFIFIYESFVIYYAFDLFLIVTVFIFLIFLSGSLIGRHRSERVQDDSGVDSRQQEDSGSHQSGADRTLRRSSQDQQGPLPLFYAQLII